MWSASDERPLLVLVSPCLRHLLTCMEFPEVASQHEEVLVQSGARSHGIHGVYGNGGNVESATYRNQRVLSGSNPTLSANMSFFVFNNLASEWVLQVQQPPVLPRSSPLRRAETGAIEPRGCSDAPSQHASRTSCGMLSLRVAVARFGRCAAVS